MVNEIFIDAENSSSFGKKDEINFKYIVLKHLSKITLICCCEFRGGYWIKKNNVTKDGKMTVEKVYVPDTREEYGNAINCLYDLLLPEIMKVKKFNDACNEIIKNIENLRSATLKKTTKDETEILSNESYGEDDKKIIEEYRFSKLRLQRKLFQELSKFLKHIDYMAGKVIEE